MKTKKSVSTEYEKQISITKYLMLLNIPQRHITDEILTEWLYRMRYLWTKNIDSKELFYKIKKEYD